MSICIGAVLARHPFVIAKSEVAACKYIYAQWGDEPETKLLLGDIRERMEHDERWRTVDVVDRPEFSDLHIRVTATFRTLAEDHTRGCINVEFAIMRVADGPVGTPLAMSSTCPRSIRDSARHVHEAALDAWSDDRRRMFVKESLESLSSLSARRSNGIRLVSVPPGATILLVAPSLGDEAHPRRFRDTTQAQGTVLPCFAAGERVSGTLTMPGYHPQRFEATASNPVVLQSFTLVADQKPSIDGNGEPAIRASSGGNEDRASAPLDLGWLRVVLLGLAGAALAVLVGRRRRIWASSKRLARKDRTGRAQVLFLGANPEESTRLALTKEVTAIEQRILEVNAFDSYRLVQKWEVEASKLQGLILLYAPPIVQFSGHGTPTGELVFQSADGFPAPISPERLATMFSVLNKYVKCVILNACFSRLQADEIVKHVDVVVGMNNEIKDVDAIIFSSAFHQALARGEDVMSGFVLACNAIGIDSDTCMRVAGTQRDIVARASEKARSAVEIPQLLVRPGVDPSTVRFSEPRAQSGS